MNNKAEETGITHEKINFQKAEINPKSITFPNLNVSHEAKKLFPESIVQDGITASELKELKENYDKSKQEYEKALSIYTKNIFSRIRIMEDEKLQPNEIVVVCGNIVYQFLNTKEGIKEMSNVEFRNKHS